MKNKYFKILVKKSPHRIFRSRKLELQCNICSENYQFIIFYCCDNISKIVVDDDYDDDMMMMMIEKNKSVFVVFFYSLRIVSMGCLGKKIFN